MAADPRTPDILRDARRIVSDAAFAQTCTDGQRKIAWIILRSQDRRITPPCLRLPALSTHDPKDAA